MALGLDNAALVSYRPTVRALIAHLLGVGLAHADVEDCTSEALRRALEGAARLQPGAAMRPWLLGIARHVALDARRARSRARLRQGDQGDGVEDNGSTALDKVATQLPDPHEQAVLAQRSARLQRALDTLPVTQRRALSLHADGLGYREISAELKVPLGTVCTWIARGRQTLARALAEMEEASPDTLLGEAGHNSSEASS
jgi:RNA polymerase sigma factor (sigma-70 family)